MKKRKIVISKKAKHWKDKFPLVQVEWLDICADASWQSIEDLSNAQLAICVSKGHLLSQSKGITRLFSDYNEANDGTIDEVGNSTIIPNACIKSIKKI